LPARIMVAWLCPSVLCFEECDELRSSTVQYVLPGTNFTTIDKIEHSTDAEGLKRSWPDSLKRTQTNSTRKYST
jgi:hypothetical protein